MVVIAFTNNEGGVSIITPAPDSGINIEEIAAKDAPKDRPYWIIDDSDLPDRALRDQWIIVNGQVLINPDKPITVKQPNPKGFYEKAVGVNGDSYPLTLIYQSLSRRALDETQDTSALVAALLIYNGALNTNDWTQPYAKELYKNAYEKLKPFLSTGQISIIDAENIAFGLV